VNPAMSSPVAPPPLTKWQLVWRNLVAFGFGAVVWGAVASAQWRESRWLLVTDLSLGVLSMVLYQFRRRWPVPVVLLTMLISSVSASSVGAAVLAFISLATRRRLVEIVPLGVLSVLGGQVYTVVQPDAEDRWYVSFVSGIAFTAVASAIGMYIGARRELLATLEDRAERAEREQGLRVAQAQAQERTRIAREMHDVLAHRMSLVAMHAGALAYRDNLTPEETREAAEIIQANSHRALTDLREILGVLRDSDAEESPHRPQPTLSSLDELIEDERIAGARISLTCDLTHPEEVPESVGRTAYRVIQESLTNARKHSPDTQVEVTVTGEPGTGLTVEVSNPLRVGSKPTSTPGAGFGLIGLAERATLAHGSFEQGRTAGGHFVVRSWLPWPS
jgi:signal transduction histidine kinase